MLTTSPRPGRFRNGINEARGHLYQLKISVEVGMQVSLVSRTFCRWKSFDEDVIVQQSGPSFLTWYAYPPTWDLGPVSLLRSKLRNMYRVLYPDRNP